MDFTQPYTAACFALIPSLQLYVLAQVFRFAVQHASPDGAGSLGYKLVTYCEQPPGCSEKILDEMDRAHREGAQTIVTIFYAGMEPARSLFVNVLQVEINLSQIRIHRSTLKMNFRGALPSILGLLKAFQWNVVGFIHRYELEARDVVAGLEQSDQGEICIEFTEQSIFDGRKLMDKISSSKSNVTLVMDESALYYMSRAGQEENRTTEKHIIHCCYGVTFGLAGLEYKVFQGMWSLHQRPRLVPGFLDYLLDTNTHPSANATVGYLFRKVCHQCTANPSSENPCRSFNNPGPVNISAARLSHRDPDICLGAPAINMCRLCLDRLAYLDVIFIMDLFMQKLARVIEELSQNYPPSRPQNSSDFNREQLEQFLINNYSPLLPANPNSFEVFYWNVTDDGEVKLPQLDVDMERAASDSYDPVARTVGLRGRGAIRILPSHCSRGCGQGEVQKLHPDLPQHCCYACEVCSPGTYSNGSALESCWSCPQDEWSHGGQVSCWKKAVVYLFWSEPPSIVLIMLTLVGMALTASVTALCEAHRHPYWQSCRGAHILLPHGQPAGLLCQRVPLCWGANRLEVQTSPAGLRGELHAVPCQHPGQMRPDSGCLHHSRGKTDKAADQPLSDCSWRPARSAVHHLLFVAPP
ncbi:vomeronasal type-2 receptor 1-like [Chrysemys picta bellii]|uniref:vomeronasal type-2 receptor 1-like n=1 Tax=Chrysemys picta bellii TaxID=8478 RepID=UPI0032B15613